MSDETLRHQSKTEVIAIRVTPKMRYALELHSRLQHRSVGQTVERALGQYLADPEEGLVSDNERGERHFIIDEVWSASPAVRLIRLATLYPKLLSYEEEVAWEVICRGLGYEVPGFSAQDSPERCYDLHRLERDWPVLMEQAAALLQSGNTKKSKTTARNAS